MPSLKMTYLLAITIVSLLTVVECAQLTTPMPMEYLVQKWRMWFNVLDMSHHKKIAKTDVTQAWTTFANLHHLDADKRTAVVAAMDKFWNEYIFRGNPGPITEQDFVDALIKDYKSDKKAFENWVKRFLRDIINIEDLKQVGVMAEEDYVNCFLALGHEAADAVKLFNAFKPVHGKVPVSHMNAAWLHFLTSEDSTEPDFLRDALQSAFGVTK